jgi:hypothetical protein
MGVEVISGILMKLVSWNQLISLYCVFDFEHFMTCYDKEQ